MIGQRYIAMHDVATKTYCKITATFSVIHRLHSSVDRKA